MKNINFTAFDFETAYGQKNACQLGIVVVRNSEIVEEKSFYIKPPENKISAHCQKVHGIKPSMTKDAPTFDELWDGIKHYFECQVIVHHSDGFDMRILNQEFQYYNIKPCRFLACESTMFLFPDQYSRSLANLCKAYNIDNSNHHEALADARNCALLFLKYLDGIDPDYNILPKKNTGTGFSDKTEISINLSWTDNERKIDKDTFVQNLDIVSNRNTIFYDKKIVISGVFDRYPRRNDLGVLLKSYGADINSTISAKTNIFVVGSDCGPAKLQKVLELKDKDVDILILEEKELYKMLDTINQ